MNVSSVEPVVVSALGGTEIVLSGSGFMAAAASSSSGVYCGIGGLSWSSSKATVVSASEARCVVPARGDGMRVVEVSINAGGELSHSGVQVEYMGGSEVHSVWPSSGAVSGGTVVTLVGEGFVSGVTGCRFGSSSVVEAEVLSSKEATCVSSAGVRGQQVLELSTPSISNAVFVMEEIAEVSSVEPSIVSAAGGESMMVVSDGTPVACLFDGRVSVTAQMMGDGPSMACRTVAMPTGNTSVQVSVNGQEWSTSVSSVQLVGAMNVSSVEPVVVSALGGTEIVLSGSGFMAAAAASS